MPSERDTPTARQRARAAVMADLTAEARRQLADVGPAHLSVRAVARALGMPSSGIYRYVSSRDELLTLLIVDGYESLADTLEATAAELPGDSPAERRRRFLAVTAAIWDWAEAHPHEYALLYGTPVPGYAAPEATIAPVERFSVTLLEPLAGLPALDNPAPKGPLADDAAAVGQLLGDLAPSTVLVALGAWATIFGAISLHRFGHTNNVVSDGRDWFVQTMELQADHLGLDPRPLEKAASTG